MPGNSRVARSGPAAAAPGSVTVAFARPEPGTIASRCSCAPGRAVVRYESCQVRASSLARLVYRELNPAVELACRYEPPVAAASSRSGAGVKLGPPMPIVYTAACADRAAAIACAAVWLLETSAPSVTTTIARP